jgi:hypothetical protein
VTGCCQDLRDKISRWSGMSIDTPVAEGTDREWLVEQRYRAVLEVLDSCPVTEVAVRYGVSRQAVYRWKARYAAGGLDG